MDREKLKQIILSEPEDFVYYLKELIGADRIDDEVALGISKFVIANGLEKLTSKQWYTLLEKGIMEYNYVDECKRCSSTIPWSEMIEAVYFYEDGLCSYCNHMVYKND